MKTTLLATITLLACSIAWSGGLYLVSGSDFRPTRIKYVVRTDTDNQTIQVSPDKIRTLLMYKSNMSWSSPWSITTDGNKFEYGPKDNIGQTLLDPSNVNYNGATNVVPLQYTYANAGLHMVKLYEEKGNVYQIQFIENPYIVSLWVNWEDLPSVFIFQTVIECSNCPNLKSLYVGTSANQKYKILDNFYNCTNLENLVFSHPENFEYIKTSAFARSFMTNDMVFVNVTNMLAGAFSGTKRVKYASFPNIQNIEGNVFNNSATINGYAWGKGGLERFGIGDKLVSVGQNALYATTNLKTLEFTTDEEDWISFWNSHPLFPNWLGTLTPIDGKPDEATIALPTWTGDTTYFTSSSGRPTNLSKVIRLRRTNQ